MSAAPHVVVLGGGFAGAYAAMELERRLGDAARITLVNRENFFLFTPMLHEVAASDLDVTHIVNPLRKLLRRATLFHGSVERIDLAARKVVVSHGVDAGHPHELDYDHLVVALGSITNFHGTPGVAARALTMKSSGDAIGLRNRLIENLEEADFECCPKVRERMLNFVVAGGGFAGVETAAAMHDFLEEARRFYPHLSDSRARVVLVHSGTEILPELDARLGAYARETLGARGVEIRLGERVAGFSDDGVSLSGGSLVPTRTLVWTAGTSSHPLVQALPCVLERGRIVVNEFLEAEGTPGLWALGDCARVPDLVTGGVCPPTAQHASRQAKVLAANVAAAIGRGRRRPFRFRTLGQLASLGHRRGVAQILGMRFSGFVAWWLWRTIYLSKLPRFERKVRVALDWTLDLFFSKDLVHTPVTRGPAIVGEEAAPAAAPRAAAPLTLAVATPR